MSIWLMRRGEQKAYGLGLRRLQNHNIEANMIQRIKLEEDGAKHNTMSTKERVEKKGRRQRQDKR